MSRCIRFAPGVCLFLLSFAAGPARAMPPDDDQVLRNTLAVQQAMEQAQHYLLVPDSKKAVEVLEAQLSRINGNTTFLRVLRDAYRSHIKDLWLSNQGTLAKKYLERLCIIDPGAAQDPILSGSQRPAAKSGVPAFAKATPTISPQAEAQRAVRARQEDPFDGVNQRASVSPQNAAARQLLTTAETEFARKRYAEARVFYERAYQADPQTIEPCRDRWAYCMLNHVVEQLNQPKLNATALAELQKQVHGAVTMAPALDATGKWLLGEIETRSRTQVAGTGPDVRPDPVVGVQHLGRDASGWQVAETDHFRIFHNQQREYVERVAQVAERTRHEMFRKWFGHDGVAWQPKCDLFLHANAGDYSRVTGVPSNSPGHARIETDPSGQRVVSRRMDMHCDQAGMLDKVLPHETTHVVLAGMFGPHAVPRWADEGMAVLTEPTEKVEQHRRNLHASRQMLFSVRDLMQLADYPEKRRIGAFYAQSVFVVEFLAQQRGPLVFSEFLRDSLREGYEPALRRHYGWSFADVESRWTQYAFGDKLAQSR